MVPILRYLPPKRNLGSRNATVVIEKNISGCDRFYYFIIYFIIYYFIIYYFIIKFF